MITAAFICFQGGSCRLDWPDPIPQDQAEQEARAAADGEIIYTLRFTRLDGTTFTL